MKGRYYNQMINIKDYEDVVFPTDFLWGVSTAGQQIEGNNNSFYDDEETAPKKPGYVMAGKACNSYNMYEEDIQLIKAMHLNTYRMSLEWSRIEPVEGEFNQEAIEHYHKVLSSLKREGIQVALTLHHNSHPVWFEKKKAFHTMDNLDYWLSYVKLVVQEYDQYVDYYLTLNEINIVFEYSRDEGINLLQYHAKAYQLIKQYSTKPVSLPLNYAQKQPMRAYDEADQLMAQYIDYMEQGFFINAIRTGEIVVPEHDALMIPELKDSVDFWAINVYTRQLINSRKKLFRFDHYNATHFHSSDEPFFSDEICPEVIYNALHRLSDKPILITENGIATTHDRYRIIYIASMLQAIHQAMDEGVKVLGYFHWSLLDNWEWGSYMPKFGLATYDHETYKRTLKKSGKFYGAIAKEGKLTQDIIQQFYK